MALTKIWLEKAELRYGHGHVAVESKASSFRRADLGQGTACSPGFPEAAKNTELILAFSEKYRIEMVVSLWLQLCISLENGSGSCRGAFPVQFCKTL